MHLMLLFIDPAFYQINILPVCFNTSHVTLYQKAIQKQKHRKRVSIHLMLLFIEKNIINKDLGIMFQYISCYSLSNLDGAISDSVFLFQYISCYSLSLASLLN